MQKAISLTALTLVMVGCAGLLSLHEHKAQASKHFQKEGTQEIAKSAVDGASYKPRKKGTLTYTKDIAPIVLKHCADCHREGEVAPFSLLTYAEAKKHAAQIALVTEKRLMPPWKAESHGEFVGENRLTSDQIGMLRQWCEEGMKEGKASDLPPAPTFTTGWKMGKPDAEIAPAKPYTLGPEGSDEFHTFLLHTDFPEDRYVAGVEVRPGNKAVVHHTLLSVDKSGRVRRLADAKGVTDFGSTGGNGVPENLLDIWTPGKSPERLPKGIGMLLPKGSDLVLEIHYHRTGKPEPDQTKIGLYFCKEPVTQQLRVAMLPAFPLNIPPGEARYETSGVLVSPQNTTLRSIFPHMHLIGKRMKVTMTPPGGEEKTLIDIPDWDFNWQNTYWYKQPITIPKGTKIKMTAIYDNSASNPRNPHNPPKRMGWGEQTTNEMGLVFFGYTLDAERLAK